MTLVSTFKSMRWWLFALVVVLIGLSTLVAIKSEGKSLPEGIMLATIEGQSVQLDEFKGKPLIINFWATWCPPCIREMPLLNRYDDLQDVDVILINQGEAVPVIKSYLEKADISFRNMLLDPRQQSLQSLEIRGLPTTLFYSAEGVLVDQHMGEVTAEQLDAFIQRYAAPNDRKS
ncbi:TlpA family protein disulfide reductase [Nitrincola sp. MINF-07-Sa-05]|uniref:TlpA family protein disulfide reductase n=1 Tax=Nitrincola salilacus TaxID=3400273 RepID=UPI0039181424